jgi:hypothetical protein
VTAANRAQAAADVEQELKRLYRARQKPELVEVPELGFLMLDGHGDPNVSERYREAIQALYAVAYTLKFALERGGGPDFRVSPLEGLWWAEDMTRFAEDRSAWEWTMMIRQPAAVTPELVAAHAPEVAGKKELPAARDIRLERFAEGLAAQVLHVGPYADEGPTIGRLHAFIEEQGYVRRGRHHEIYLGDPRRAAPERLRTIVRQPVGVVRGLSPGHAHPAHT